MAALQAVPQMALDEQVVDDTDVEAALEEREKRKASASAVRKLYKEARERAIAEIAKLELPEGGAARVGRFRVTRRTTPGRSVSFETEPSSRVRIALVDKE